MRKDLKVVFLDRDGVINKYPGDGGYVLNKEHLKVFPYSASAVKELKDSGWMIYIISNQACVSKGLVSEKALKDMTEYMLSDIEQGEKRIDGVYYCVHQDSDNCPYRKPAPGMINEVIKNLTRAEDGADLPDKNKLTAFFVGDSIRDVETAKNAKADIKTVLVLSGRASLEDKDNWNVQPDYICKDLKDAVAILNRDSPHLF